MVKYERTNCANCGAALVDRKCPFCGTQWVPVGFQVGEHGFVKSSTVRFCSNPLEVTSFGRAYRQFTPAPMECEVSLEIVGLTSEEATRIWVAIRDAMQ
jgi:hypothetical protein